MNKNSKEYLNNTTDKRMVIDFIAGMTDDLFIKEIEKTCKKQENVV